MRLKRTTACLILCALLLALLPWALDGLPAAPGELAGRKYAGFSGVLQLWAAEGWEPGAGSLAGWLNEAVRRFERRHKGVYVVVTAVKPQALAAFRDAAVVPDMILFPPGLIPGAEDFLPLANDRVRSDLRAAGRWAGETRALPVALGGYALARNAALLPALPADWQEASVRAGAFLVNMPADSPFHAWRRATEGLLSAAGQAGTPPPAGEGLDLGLAPEDTPAPTAGIPRDAPGPVRLPEALPEDFGGGAAQEVYRGFVRGRYAVIPVTQREIARLEALGETGKGPDAVIEAPGQGAFTDQLALAAIPATNRPEGEARRALCRELIDCLLSEEGQSMLSRCGAFRVDGGQRLYAAGGMAALERALSGPLTVPAGFADADLT